MEDIAKFFIGLFKELRPPLRWLAIAGSIGTLLIGLFVYEQITQNIYLTKLEKKVGLLKELQVVAGQGIQNNPELYPIYVGLVGELNTFQPPIDKPSIAGDISRVDMIRTGKAISGALPWVLLFFLVAGYQIRIDRGWTGLTVSLAVFFIIAAGIFAWIGSTLPTFYHPWVNYLLFPLVQLAALVWIVRHKA